MYNRPTRRPQPPEPRLTPTEYFRRREFENYLRDLGASKSQAVKMTTLAPQHVMAQLLPLHRRLFIAWRARRE